MRVRVVKPWRFSRHGYDVEAAGVGDVIDISDVLVAAGLSTGHVETMDAIRRAPDAQAHVAAPEAKRRGRPRKV